MIILGKSGEHRTREDLQKLKRYFEDLSFFQSLKKKETLNEDDDLVLQCCKELKYREYEEGEVVCNYGEEGHEFYSVMHGKVHIYVPKSVELCVTF